MAARWGGVVGFGHQGRKAFFFEKRSKKRLLLTAAWRPRSGSANADRCAELARVLKQADLTKVFWSFFSKKDCLLS